MDEDYEFSRPFMRDACSCCNYVFGGSNALASPKLTCPRCGHTDTPEIYPDPTNLRLLDIVGYFDRFATEHAYPLPEMLVSAVQDEVGRSYPSKQLVQLSQQLDKLWKRRVQNQMTPSIEDLVQQTRKTLKLTTDDEAQRIWPCVIGYSGTVNEHIAATIMVCTFLEAMFNQMLERIGKASMSTGEEYDQVDDKIEDLRSFKARTEYFKSLTNQSFKEAMDETTHSSFYDSWNRVRTARNDFVHGNPWAIKAPIAVLAVQLARDAVSVFASLQNMYAIRSVCGHEDSGQSRDDM